ncbi:hypothetical protein ABK040_005679 [Willaertia magna]
MPNSKKSNKSKNKKNNASQNNNKRSLGNNVNHSMNGSSNTSNNNNSTEYQTIAIYWKNLTTEDRKKLLNVNAHDLLRKIKEQHQRVCSCTVCGRNRAVLDREIERLFTDYCRELSFPNNIPFDFRKEHVAMNKSNNDRNGSSNGGNNPTNNNNNNGHSHHHTTKSRIVRRNGNTTEFTTKTTTVKNGSRIQVIEKTVKYISASANGSSTTTTTRIVNENKLNNNNNTNGSNNVLNRSGPIIEDITEHENNNQGVVVQEATGNNQQQQQPSLSNPPIGNVNPKQSTNSGSAQNETSQNNITPNVQQPHHQLHSATEREDFLQYDFGKNLSIDKNGTVSLSEDWLKHNEGHVIVLLQQFEQHTKSSNLEQYILNRERNSSGDEDDDEYSDEDEEEDEEETDEDEEEEEDEECSSGDEGCCHGVDEMKWRESRRVFKLFAAKAFYDNIVNAYKEKIAKDMQAKLIEEEEMQEKKKKKKEMDKKKQRKMEEERKRLEKEMIEALKKEQQQQQQQQKTTSSVVENSNNNNENITESQVETPIEKQTVVSKNVNITEEKPKIITQVLFENDMTDVSVKTTPEQFPRYQVKPTTTTASNKKQNKKNEKVPIVQPEKPQPRKKDKKKNITNTNSKDKIIIQQPPSVNDKPKEDISVKSERSETSFESNTMNSIESINMENSSNSNTIEQQHSSLLLENTNNIQPQFHIASENDKIVHTNRTTPSPPIQHHFQTAPPNAWQPMVNNGFQFNQFLPINNGMSHPQNFMPKNVPQQSMYYGNGMPSSTPIGGNQFNHGQFNLFGQMHPVNTNQFSNTLPFLNGYPGNVNAMNGANSFYSWNDQNAMNNQYGMPQPWMNNPPQNSGNNVHNQSGGYSGSLFSDFSPNLPTPIMNRNVSNNTPTANSIPVSTSTMHNSNTVGSLFTSNFNLFTPKQ